MNNVFLLIIGECIYGSGPSPVPPTPVFPCTILSGTTYTVTSDTVTSCDPIFIQNNATLVINQPYILTQNNP